MDTYQNTIDCLYRGGGVIPLVSVNFYNDSNILIAQNREKQVNAKKYFNDDSFEPVLWTIADNGKPFTPKVVTDKTSGMLQLRARMTGFDTSQQGVCIYKVTYAYGHLYLGLYAGSYNTLSELARRGIYNTVLMTPTVTHPSFET